jgi:hypothetical protein
MSYTLPEFARDALGTAQTQDGLSLRELAAKRPQMLVFLRHFG